MKNFMIKPDARTILILGLLFFSGCAIPMRESDNQPVSLSGKLSQLKSQTSRIRPEAKIDLVPAVPQEYRLGYGDVLEVKFFNHPEFNEQVFIRPDGRISLQQVGDILAVGMTPARLDSLITLIYAEILLNPNITVFVRQFGGHQLYVFGEVDRPGAYPLDRDMTLLRALAAAGGPKASGNLKSVLLIRKSPNNTVRAVRADISMRSLQDDLRQDLILQANDVIFVPKTFISNINGFLAQIYDGILPPLDIYTRWQLWCR